MFPFPAAMLQGGSSPQAKHVGSTVVLNPAPDFTIPWPTGTAVGDLAIFVGGYGSVSTPAGWTRFTDAWSTFGYTITLAYRIIVSGDLTTAPAFSSLSSSCPGALAVYRGPTALSRKGTHATAYPPAAPDTDYAVDLASMTPSASGKGFFIYMLDRSSNYADPAPGIRRAAGAGGYFMMEVGDVIPYNGGDIIWTSDVVSGTGRFAGAYEFT